MNELELEKRKWFYIAQPKDFCIPACSCGNEETQWSEYEKHLWCSKCEKDFIPENNGIFDGPILIEVAQNLGVNFNRFNIEKEKIEVLDSKFNYIEVQYFENIVKNNYIDVEVRNENNDFICLNKFFYNDFSFEDSNFKDSFSIIEMVIIADKKINLIKLFFKFNNDKIEVIKDKNYEYFNRFMLKNLLELNLKSSNIDKPTKKV